MKFAGHGDMDAVKCEAVSETMRMILLNINGNNT